MIDARVATGDALLYALELSAVVSRLRAIAPDLVEAAELEVALERRPR